MQRRFSVGDEENLVCGLPEEAYDLWVGENSSIFALCRTADPSKVELSKRHVLKHFLFVVVLVYRTILLLGCLKKTYLIVRISCTSIFAEEEDKGSSLRRKRNFSLMKRERVGDDSKRKKGVKSGDVRQKNPVRIPLPTTILLRYQLKRCKQEGEGDP